MPTKCSIAAFAAQPISHFPRLLSLLRVLKNDNFANRSLIFFFSSSQPKVLPRPHIITIWVFDHRVTPVFALNSFKKEALGLWRWAAFWKVVLLLWNQRYGSNSLGKLFTALKIQYNPPRVYYITFRIIMRGATKPWKVTQLLNENSVTSLSGCIILDYSSFCVRTCLTEVAAVRNGCPRLMNVASRGSGCFQDDEAHTKLKYLHGYVGIGFVPFLWTVLQYFFPPTLCSNSRALTPQKFSSRHLLCNFVSISRIRFIFNGLLLLPFFIFPRPPSLAPFPSFIIIIVIIIIIIIMILSSPSHLIPPSGRVPLPPHKGTWPWFFFSQSKHSNLAIDFSSVQRHREYCLPMVQSHLDPSKLVHDPGKTILARGGGGWWWRFPWDEGMD